MSSSHELPARASLEHLRNEAKQRLRELRAQDASARLTDAQLVVAREYGFASWRRLKATLDERDRERAFAAAYDGDLEAVRRALDGGFNPGATDATGRTIHQIARLSATRTSSCSCACTRNATSGTTRSSTPSRPFRSAAAEGRAEELHRLLDTHPELVDAPSVKWHRQTALHKAAWKNRRECVRLLLERGANVGIRDFGDNAYPLHFAAAEADLAIVEMLVEAGLGRRRRGRRPSPRRARLGDVPGPRS